MHVPIVLNVYNVYIERNKEKNCFVIFVMILKRLLRLRNRNEQKNVFEMCY